MIIKTKKIVSLIIILSFSGCFKGKDIADKFNKFKNPGEESNTKENPNSNPAHHLKSDGYAEVLVTSESKEDLALMRVTPRTKGLNLCRAYGHSEEESLKKLLLKQIKVSENDYDEKLDNELKTCLYRFIPMIENAKEEALNIILAWWQILRGENKMQALTVLAQGFDYLPTSLITLITQNYPQLDCSFVVLLLPDIRNEQKRNYLIERGKILLNAKEQLKENLGRLDFLNSCLQRLGLEVQHSFYQAKAESTQDQVKIPKK